MKIYFARSIRAGVGYESFYQHARSVLKSLGHQLAFDNDRPPLILKKTNDRLIFTRDIRALESAEIVIADVSQPSLGVGYEIAQAIAKGIPVVGLYYSVGPTPLSAMIAGNPNLKVYRYRDLTQLETILKTKIQPLQKSKLIVIEGGDGTGKATQVRRLVRQIRKTGLSVKSIRFPIYNRSFSTQLVKRYLSGNFGQLETIDPHLAAILFAVNRSMAKNRLNQWLAHGFHVIADRYVSSNLAYQAARLPIAKQPAFIDWLTQLEYRDFQVPRPALTILLNLPVSKAQALIKHRRRPTDIHEQNEPYLEAVRQLYLKLARRNHWPIVEVARDENLRSPTDIHQQIWSIVESLILKL